MGVHRFTGRRDLRAAILREVYQANTAPDGPERRESRSFRLPRRWGIWLAVALLPVTVALFLHLQPQEGDAPVAAAENQAAGWDGSLPPLIADANAGVAVRSGYSFMEQPAMFAGGGAFASAVEWTRRLDSAEDYQSLLQQPGMALADLFGLEVRTIVIDPGHGGDDPGAIGANGLKEKDITLKIARLLYNRLLDEEGLNVVLTRDSDVTLSLRQRVEHASRLDADLLISIHLNTIPGDPMAIVETYYFGSPSDPQSLEVARLENRHSEYAVADFDELIAQLGDTLKQQESRRLASHIQRSVYGSLRRGNRRLIDAGIKTAPFVVLMGAGIPSVLAEVTCISNTAEEARLATPAYRDRIAEALERGILSYLNQLRVKEHHYSVNR